MESAAATADPIRASNTAAIDTAYAQHQRAQRLGKGKEAEFKPPAMPAFASAPAAAASAPAQLLRSAANAVRGAPPQSAASDDEGDDAENDDGEPEPDEDEVAATKRRSSLAAKINDYYRCFPDTKPGGKDQRKPPVWSSGSKEDALQAEYERVRGVMDGAANRQVVNQCFLALMNGAELLTLDTDRGGFGINPLHLNLEGVTGAANNNIVIFEPELTEAAIEMRDWLGSSWHVRLAFKMVSFAQQYSKLKSDPAYLERMRQAQQAARAAAADAAAPRAAGGNRPAPASSDDL